MFPCPHYDKLHTYIHIYIQFLIKENRENHGFKIMAPKPWVQNHEPKATSIDYSKYLENHGTKIMGSKPQL